MATLQERWERSFAVDAETGCWVWTKALHAKGYGVIAVGRSSDRAHRVAWKLNKGPIPAGLMVLHRCDNPPCVNPAHLFLGTNSDNMRDAVGKGRHRTQPRKMTADDVRRARIDGLRGTLRLKTRARQLGVSPSTLRDAIEGRTWKSI